MYVSIDLLDLVTTNKKKKADLHVNWTNSCELIKNLCFESIYI